MARYRCATIHALKTAFMQEVYRTELAGVEQLLGQKSWHGIRPSPD
ncbi:MAG: hypothetical protein SNJ57_07710 [Cyanobacteriota bacterium]